MNKPNILLVGAGGHARACIDVIEQEGRYCITGLIGLPQEVKASVLGYAVIGSNEDIPAIRTKCSLALVAVGQIKSPKLRISLFNLLREQKFKLPFIASSRAYISPHASLGDGSIAMHGAIINAGARIGKNCIINSQALIEHDAVIEDHCHISTSALINGGSRVGSGSFVGSGSVLQEGISLGERSLVGMGVIVRSNLPAFSRLVQ